MFTENLKSAGIAGVVAFFMFLLFAPLEGDTVTSALLPSLLRGVATFIVALMISMSISSYRKKRHKQ
jgi:amino acid transporter